MRNDVAFQRRLSIAMRIHKMIPGVQYAGNDDQFDVVLIIKSLI